LPTALAKNGLVAGAGGVTVAPAMKTLSERRKVSGLTLIELLLVICVIFILAAMLLPALSDREPRHPTGVMCMSNQKRIAIALIMFQDDHNGKYPRQVSTTNNGSFELTSNGLATDQFLTIAAYLGNRPQVLCVPQTKPVRRQQTFPQSKIQISAIF
jgi:competence protein ComGC